MDRSFIRVVSGCKCGARRTQSRARSSYAEPQPTLAVASSLRRQNYDNETEFPWYVVGTRTRYAYQVRTWYGFCVNVLIGNKIQSCKTHTH